MSELATVGLDLAQYLLRAHGADALGRAVLRRKLRPDQVLALFAQLPPCHVAMEASGGAHFWGREIERQGYEVQLIPPAFVNPSVKRQKNDATDPEAICEGELLPTIASCPSRDVRSSERYSKKDRDPLIESHH